MSQKEQDELSELMAKGMKGNKVSLKQLEDCLRCARDFSTLTKAPTEEGIRQSICLHDREKKGAILEDFEILKLIGVGTFGKVYLTQNILTNKLYAMKCIRKDLIIEHDQLNNISREKDILWKVNHPFLINMDYVFQDFFRIYFIMPFIKGGMIFSHL